MATRKTSRVSTINLTNFSELSVGDIVSRDKAKLMTLLRRKANCFSAGEHDLGLTHLGEMEIKLNEGARCECLLSLTGCHMQRGER